MQRDGFFHPSIQERLSLLSLDFADDDSPQKPFGGKKPIF